MAATDLLRKGIGNHKQETYAGLSGVLAVQQVIRQYDAAYNAASKRSLYALKKSRTEHTPRAETEPYEKRFAVIAHLLRKPVIDWPQTLGYLRIKLAGWCEQELWPKTLVDWEYCCDVRTELLRQKEEGLLAAQTGNSYALKGLYEETMKQTNRFLTQARMHLAGTELR